jgi:transcriptional regulator GlxA family with amidase domain
MGAEARMRTRTVGVLLFPDFEPLDVFGPVEAFAIAQVPGEEPGGKSPFRMVAVAERAGPVAMRGGLRAVADHSLADCPPLDLLLVPGGLGTRSEVRNPALLGFIRDQSDRVEVLASICTGAALLGCAGVLSGLEATTNRVAFDWVMGVCPPDIRWNRSQRWVDAGRVATSAGVSAGTDMALHLLERLLAPGAAEATARRMEYRWSPNPAEG